MKGYYDYKRKEAERVKNIETENERLRNYIGEMKIRYGEELSALQVENQRLRDDFSSYRNTAEEISQCYTDCHRDSWDFEKSLRRIANKSLDESNNVGPADGEVPRKIALEALETVWKRRQERSEALQPKKASE